MAVTEQPVDIVSTRNGNTFVLGDHTKRSAWVNSFYIPANANVSYFGSFYDPLSPPFVAYGAVKNNSGATTDQIGYQNQGTVTGMQRVYVID